MAMRTLRNTGIALLVAASSAAFATPANAKRGDIVRTGPCSTHSDWKLKLGSSDGHIETEFQVDSNRAGQKWNVRLTDNGMPVFAGTATTKARSGSFTIERSIANRA